jgi:hypothetical protein
MNKMNLFFMAGSSCLLLACADSNYTMPRLDGHFGQTHKQLLQAQMVNPEAALNPSPNPPEKLDGYAGFQTMKSYREGFAQTIEPSQDISINLNSVSGSGSNSKK